MFSYNVFGFEIRVQYWAQNDLKYSLQFSEGVCVELAFFFLKYVVEVISENGQL